MLLMTTRGMVVATASNERGARACVRREREGLIERESVREESEKSECVRGEDRVCERSDGECVRGYLLCVKGVHRVVDDDKGHGGGPRLKRLVDRQVRPPLLERGGGASVSTTI